MIMIKKLLLLSLLFLIKNLYCQIEVLESYPYGQNFYVGGIYQLNKEMVQIVKAQKLLPCEKGEKYSVKVIVYDNSTINYVKDFDTLEIKKNKCAFDFSRQLFPYLKKWMPAKENGKFVAAIAKIDVMPFYLFHSKDDPKDNVMKNPTFKKGIEAFGFEVKSIFERYIKRNEDKRVSLTFVVTENGEMEDFKIEGDFSENDKKSIISSLSRIKGKWNPATFNNIPYRARMRQPVTQQFDWNIQIDENNKMMNQNYYNNRYR